MKTQQYLTRIKPLQYGSHHRRVLVQRAINSAASPCVKVATKPLPVCLRQGMERISGVNLQRVRVHYNSHKPSQVQAQAYAQGEDIYLAPGQERHLPHELGHVVQQKVGMVEPTMDVNGVAVNDDPRLEQHATELGEMAVRVGGNWLPICR
ncbi:DUF4157 domain-containing protein [Vibrio sp. V39_P1S14PM300]|nr:DUF4157 domain-containing protein [Vibrio sp. V39_P1S14PM300]